MKSRFLLLLILVSLLVTAGCAKKPAKEVPPASPPVESETKSAVESDTGLYLSISEAYALNLLQSSLPAGTPFTVSTIDFSADSTIKISGKVNLRELGEANALPLWNLYPDSVDFSSAGRFVYNKESGVTITPLSLEVLSFEIPLDVLPESLYQPYQEKINQYLDSLPTTLSDLIMTDDAIVLIG